MAAGKKSPDDKTPVSNKEKNDAAKKLEKGEAPVKKEAPPAPKKPKTYPELLRQCVEWITLGISGREPRLVTRSLRFLIRLRRCVKPADLYKMIDTLLPESCPAKKGLLDAANVAQQKFNVKEDTKMVDVSPPPPAEGAKDTAEGEAKEEETPEVKSDPFEKPSRDNEQAMPEIVLFLSICVANIFLDNNAGVEAEKVADEALQFAATHSKRRGLDALSARLNFALSRAFELQGRLPEIRERMLSAYRSCVLHNDAVGQATCLNLILRNYISCHLYEQAMKFVSKTVFPEQLRSNAQLARYLYYIGRIKAVQLDYSDAHNKLMQAIRKAPQSPQIAEGFRLSAYRMAIVVELLMGDIPERSVFEQPELKRPLKPYFSIVQAVRMGDLPAFKAVVAQYHDRFERDETLFLINRLQSNVIKTGLRWINLSYRRISLKDVAAKLQLDAAADVESIVAKNILDGVIEATIDHDSQCLESKILPDIYATDEPLRAYHKRIMFCLQLHNDAVKAMQYPRETTHGDIADAETRRIRQQELMARSQSEEEEDEDSEFF